MSVRKPRRLQKTADRGYGGAHRKERAKYKPAVDAGREFCRRCGRMIPPRGYGRCPVCGKNHRGWDLGHVDGSNKTQWSGPEHRCCNRAAGARLGNRRLVRRVQGLIRTSREW